MDTSEILALSIVAVAALLVVRYFFRQKNGGGCSGNCLKSKRPSEKK